MDSESAKTDLAGAGLDMRKTLASVIITEKATTEPSVVIHALTRCLQVPEVGLLALHTSSEPSHLLLFSNVCGHHRRKAGYWDVDGGATGREVSRYLGSLCCGTRIGNHPAGLWALDWLLPLSA